MAAVGDFVRSLGARPVVLDAGAHDRLMTWVSHLPHAVSASLARAAREGAGEGLAALAGPGLLDATRLANQPVSLALELALSDPDALAAALDRVSSELGGLAAALRGRDAAFLRAFFEQAESLRRGLEPEA